MFRIVLANGTDAIFILSAGRLRLTRAQRKPAGAAPWHRIPPRVRAAVLQAATLAIAPRPSRRGAVRPGPATVAGLFSAATGLGEGARLCHAAMTRLGIPAGAMDLARYFGRSDLRIDLPQDADPGTGGPLIVHLNPPHLPLGLAFIGRRRIRQSRIIGYWAWELEILPRAWRRGFRYVHEVWVPSEFVARAIRRETDLPVRVVPHPVTAPPASRLCRADFGLPADAFVALTMLDMGSGYARKNPLAAIAAFRQAFGDDPGALLLVKVAGAARAPWALRELESAIGGAGNVRLLQGALSREEHGALLRSADIVLSLHRSEGFGLLLAEAMRLGLPAVATAWSGNMQFMTEGNSALIECRLVPVHDPQGIYRETGALWAEPDIAHAASWLRKLKAEPELRRRLGEVARADAERTFGDAAYRAAIGDALAVRGGPPPS
jgi:glycosyltransferase involved in cell wall biosynthesis